MHSHKIDVNIKNCRDLGYLKTKDGFYIKKKTLIRSNYLYQASLEDMEHLYNEYSLRTIIDFRNHGEHLEKPDVIYKDINYINLPAQNDGTYGLARDKESVLALKAYFKHLREVLKDDKAKIVTHMARFYRDLCTNAYSMNQYGQFLKILLSTDNGILWHCSLGKDRAGIATILLLEALGVSKEDIYDDYLYSNECLYGSQDIKEALDIMERAVKDYIDAYYEEVNKLGGFNKYFELIGVTKEELKQLKIKYLENYH